MFKYKIINNASIQFIGKVISSGLTFISSFLIIRLIGTALYGDITKITALLAISFTALDFGINAYVVRFISDKDKHEQKQAITNLILLRIVTSLLIIFATNLIVFALPSTTGIGYTPQIKQAFILASFSILFHALYTSCNAVFQHELRYDKSVLASSLGTITSFSLTIWFLLHSPTLSRLIGSITAGYFVTGLTSLYLARSWLTTDYSFKKSLGILKQSLPIGAVLILSIIANKSDVIIQGLFRRASEIGEYGFAYKIFDFALVIPVFTMNAIYPALLKPEITKEKKAKIRRVAISFLSILSAFGALFMIVASPLILLVKPNMFIAVKSLIILSLSLPFFYLTAPLMWILIARKKERKMIKVYAAAAFINLLGNYLLASSYGVLAAAALTIVTEAVILLGLYRQVRKIGA